MRRDAREEARRCAEQAGLRYVMDDEPGIRRVRAGRGFAYRAPGGRPAGAAALRRIRALAIPPAWTEVWISPFADGHLQAVGRDARGRKQYRYHPKWCEARDCRKYDRVVDLARRLPRLRRRVHRDLGRPGLGREKVLACVVALLESGGLRVGGEEYARQNGSFGLTTLRDRHARVARGTVELRFRGKGGKPHAVAIRSRRLALVVRRCQRVPGEVLFQYLDDGGRPVAVTAADVNAYLRAAAGERFSAKDFRTWAASVLAARALRRLPAGRTPTEARRNVARAIETVSERLGNTPTICRKSYVHPAVIEDYLAGSRGRRRRTRLPGVR